MAGIERKGQQLGSVRVLTVEEGTDLSKLRKDELVELATAQGVDTQGLTKADIVAALEPSEGDT
jgi:hypothetical protein